MKLQQEQKMANEQQGLVPNPNIRPPEIKPRSTDDYTPTEESVSGKELLMKSIDNTHPAIKYHTIDEEGEEVEDKYMTLANKIAAGTLGITRNIEQALHPKSSIKLIKTKFTINNEILYSSTRKFNLDKETFSIVFEN